MEILDTVSLINSLYRPPNSVWENSRHFEFKKLSNQSKGKFGTELIAKFLNSCGNSTEAVSDEGDLRFYDFISKEWKKIEVKTATCNIKKNNKWSAWFNQIRPNQLTWDEIWLVAVFPNHVQIYRKLRKDFLLNYAKLSSTNCLSHTGTDDLIAVTLSQENENEWECVYNDSLSYSSL